MKSQKELRNIAENKKNNLKEPEGNRKSKNEL